MTPMINKRPLRNDQTESGFVVWLTGLSGSGKSSLARELEQRLFPHTSDVIILDGDTLRTGLCRDLGFSLQDRKENMRRTAEVARLFVDVGWIVIAALISPLREDRDTVREIVGVSRYLEVHCNCPLDLCEQRDIKGLYKRARAGEIRDFTGISSPYETPPSPALRLDTGVEDLGASADKLFHFIRIHKLGLPRGRS